MTNEQLALYHDLIFNTARYYSRKFPSARYDEEDVYNYIVQTLLEVRDKGALNNQNYVATVCKNAGKNYALSNSSCLCVSPATVNKISKIKRYKKQHRSYKFIAKKLKIVKLDTVKNLARTKLKTISLDDLKERHGDGCTDPLNLTAKEPAILVEEYIEFLPILEKTILRLMYVEGMTLYKIASHLKIKPHVVNAKFTKIKDKLKSRYQYYD